MNSESCRQEIRAGAVVVAALGTFLVVALLVSLMQSKTESATALEARAAERLKILDEFKTANEPLLDKYEWQDQAKGFVRVPIARAKALVLEEWRDPAAARSNLMARAEKEFYVPPPPPPPKNPYE